MNEPANEDPMTGSNENTPALLKESDPKFSLQQDEHDEVELRAKTPARDLQIEVGDYTQADGRLLNGTNLPRSSLEFKSGTMVQQRISPEEAAERTKTPLNLNSHVRTSSELRDANRHRSNHDYRDDNASNMDGQLSNRMTNQSEVDPYDLNARQGYESTSTAQINQPRTTAQKLKDKAQKIAGEDAGQDEDEESDQEAEDDLLFDEGAEKT